MRKMTRPTIINQENNESKEIKNIIEMELRPTASLTSKGVNSHSVSSLERPKVSKINSLFYNNFTKKLSTSDINLNQPQITTTQSVQFHPSQPEYITQFDSENQTISSWEEQFQIHIDKTLPAMNQNTGNNHTLKKYLQSAIDPSLSSFNFLPSCDGSTQNENSFPSKNENGNLNSDGDRNTLWQDLSPHLRTASLLSEASRIQKTRLLSHSSRKNNSEQKRVLRGERKNNETHLGKREPFCSLTTMTGHDENFSIEQLSSQDKSRFSDVFY